MAALDDQAQESCKIVLAHGIAELCRAVAVIVEVDRADNSAVPHSLAQLRNSLVELVLVHIAQDLFAELLGHALHLTADGGIVVGQVSMAALRIADAHDKAVLGKINDSLAHNRLFGILEVDGDDAADRAGRLIHQSAGLTEENILRKLADLCDLDLTELLHVIVVIFAAQDGTDADLKRCRAGQAGAAQHIAGAVAVKAAHLAAGIHNALCHAADQRGGVLGLLRLRNQNIDIDIVDLVKAQRLNADDVILIGGNDRNHVQIDGAGQHHAVVMVGVVAADLGSAGGRVKTDRAGGAVLLFKFVDQVGIALALLLHGGCTVQLGKGGVIFALCDLLFEFNGICHDSTHLSCRGGSFRRYAQNEPVFFRQTAKRTALCRFLVFSIANPAKKANIISGSFMDF